MAGEPSGVYRHEFGQEGGRSAVPKLTPIEAERIVFVLGDGRQVMARITGESLEMRTVDGPLWIVPIVSNCVHVVVGTVD